LRNLAGRGIAALNPSKESAMNLNIATLPLPSLREVRPGHGRRSRIGNIDLNHLALRQFRNVAEFLQPSSPAPDRDAIVSSARQLDRQYSGMHRAPCIQMRLRCLTALRAMSKEPEWPLQANLRQPIERIVDYAAKAQHLIPQRLPVIGGLDDAILVDLAWPALRFELDDYLSFRRLRAVEAQLCGLHPRELRFGRAQWLESLAAEAAMLHRVRRRARSPYETAPSAAMFRVHG